MGDFGSAPVKQEGFLFQYDKWPFPWPKTPWTYVERRVPRHLEQAAHDLIDNLLAENNYHDE